MKLVRALWRAAVLVAALVAPAFAAVGFGRPGGPLPGMLNEVFAQLREDPYEMELLISFGTSKGGSAGHLALALRDAAADDTVWSANFYADRDPKHARDFFTEELMIAVPKMEYLYGTRSTLGPKASFGLDYGEVYKRSVIGIRVYGVPAAEKDALRRFFLRLNEDYRSRASGTAYHGGDITYDYMNLNCAKTIGAAFRHGAGYDMLKVRDPLPLSQLVRAIAAVSANIPAEMAQQLIEQWHARGYALDVVLYKKWPHSPWVDPHDDPPIAFEALPNRFPSVRSLDFRADEGQYEDEDNLYLMHLLRRLSRYAVVIDGGSQQLLLVRSAATLPYDEASPQARSAARAQSKNLLRRLPDVVRDAAASPGEANHPYDFTAVGR